MPQRQPGADDALHALLPPDPQRIDHRDRQDIGKAVAIDPRILVGQAGGWTVGQLGRRHEIDPHADDHRIARAFEQYARTFGAVYQHIVRPFQLEIDHRGERRDGPGERDSGNQRQRRGYRIPRAELDHRRAHEIAVPVAPRAAEPSASGGLAVGDEPMPLADMLAARQPRQQVGVGRACLPGPLDRRDQNNTAAALAERTASTGINR